ncbi:MAG: hypothetical protein LUE29_00725 [Lachnospiraceae bacterium]|nr:hypothetical protein [Lachnospiraceae bacterium]
MKTVLINASPKLKGSASAYFLGLLRMFVRRHVVSEQLRRKSDYERLLAELPDADTVVFCLPLYVDGVPSHVLSFLKEMEVFCRQSDICLNVYCIANNGFIEGRQNEPLMRVFQNFCARSGLKWCGGTGIGGGVMLNVTRILFVVNLAISCFNTVLHVVQSGSLLDAGILRGFLLGVLILAFLNLGVWISVFGMGRVINSGSRRHFGEKYTRILLPSFIFILIADIFFTVTSVFNGGIFRGWLSRK